MNRIRSNWTRRWRHVKPGRKAAAVALAVGLALAPLQTAWADRTQLKPGWNMFTPDQDIQLGKQAAQQAEKQLALLNDKRVDEYVNRIGQRLASKAPGYKYPYQYKVVNDREINAFALPGGPVYINRGVIEAADNEAQLAGVMAHETSHVALRHGTNQATKAQAWQMPLAVLGAASGSSIAGAIAQLGAGFSINSILLKYSRTDESQADVMGTQILYDLNYDPRAMAQFFEKLLAEQKGKQPSQFFLDHPNPGNRMARVDEEVGKLGGPPKNYTSDSAEFQSIKQYVLTLAPPPKAPAAAAGAPSARPAAPSEQVVAYRNQELELRYPGNWKLSGQASAFSLSPDGGVVQDSKGQAALAYGVIANMFGPQPQQNNGASPTVEAATDQLIAALRQGNPNLRVKGQRTRIVMDGNRALSVQLANDSPLGGQETDWLVTTLRPDGLLYFICVAPDRDYAAYDPAFQKMISTVRFQR